MSKNISAVNEVDSHNKSRQYDLALDKWWITQCGWIRICKTVATGMIITIFWKLFRYEVKRYHFDKLIGIREFSERPDQYCFNNNFSSNIGTPENDIPPLDEVNDEDTVSTFRSLQFSTSISPSAAVRTISNLTHNSASHFPKRQKANLGGRYNRLNRGYR